MRITEQQPVGSIPTLPWHPSTAKTIQEQAARMCALPITYVTRRITASLNAPPVRFGLSSIDSYHDLLA